jgi:hypothetical protein
MTQMTDSKRKPYTPPTLSVLGDMAEMTASSSNKTDTETGSGNNPNRNRPAN